jgi:hypothetical protein
LPHLESPQQGSFESGIGLIRGWACEASRIEVQVDTGQRYPVAYGTNRGDTVAACGDSNNGFGLTYNWNLAGDGEHTLRAFADDTEFAAVDFSVTTLGEQFLVGASGEYDLTGFPQAGDTLTLRWAEPHQNFMIAASSTAKAAPSSTMPKANPTATLESPQQDSFESGIGLIRGWVCDATTVEVQIDDLPRYQVAYGTARGDTQEACGDSNNGFGFTFNWNLLGTGSHTLRAFADNAEFANVTFTVTTLGAQYLQGVSGEYDLADFPTAGKTTTVRWAEPHQNFVIVGH